MGDQPIAVTRTRVRMVVRLALLVMKLDGVHDLGSQVQGLVDLVLVGHWSRLRSPTPIPVSNRPVSHVTDALTYRLHRLKHRVELEHRRQTGFIRFDYFTQPIQTQVLLLAHTRLVGQLTQLQQHIAYQRLFDFVEQDICEAVEQLDSLHRTEKLKSERPTHMSGKDHGFEPFVDLRNRCRQLAHDLTLGTSSGVRITTERRSDHTRW